MLSPFLILQRIDVGGTLEITAEIGCGGETELIGGLLDGLLRTVRFISSILLRSFFSPILSELEVTICDFHI